jgi:hypothetical protein
MSLVCPPGWEALGVVTNGEIRGVALQRYGGTLRATLTCTPLDARTPQAAVGTNEWAAFRQLYPGRVGDLKEVIVRGKHGAKFLLKGGPLDYQDQNWFGVVYVFVVNKGPLGWKVRLRANTTDEAKLSDAEQLLAELTWK